LDRPKWGEEHYADGSTYGEKTIARASAHTSEFYEPSESEVKAQRVGSSRDREQVYLKERVSLLRKQTTSLEEEVEEKTARIGQLERRLEAYEGRPAAREEESEPSREMQSKSLVRRLQGILRR